MDSPRSGQTSQFKECLQLTDYPSTRSSYQRLMSSNKKSLLRTVFTSNGSCSCAKTKLSEVHEPVPKSKFSTHHRINTNLGRTSSSTTTSGECNGCLSSVEDEDFTSTCTMSEAETNNNVVVTKRSPLIDSFAIEKSSSDPYHDFRHSMLQMIFEKEIDSEEDLHDLLQCFLQLNAPHHHHVIVKAFNEICEDAFADTVSSTTTTTEPSTSRRNHLIRV